MVSISARAKNTNSDLPYSMRRGHIACQLQRCTLYRSVNMPFATPAAKDQRLTRPTYEAPTTMIFLREEAMIWRQMKWSVGETKQGPYRLLSDRSCTVSRRANARPFGGRPRLVHGTSGRLMLEDGLSGCCLLPPPHLHLHLHLRIHLRPHLRLSEKSTTVRTRTIKRGDT